MSSAQDYIDQIAGSDLPGGTKMQSSRQAALSALGQSGLPKPRWEDWRYTNLAPLSGEVFSHKAEAGQALTTPDGISNWPRLVVIDGVVASVQPDALPPGLALCHGTDLLENTPDWAAGLFTTSGEPLANLNLAFLASAYALRAEESAEIEGLEIIHIFTGDAQSARQIRSHIHLSKGSSLKIFNRYLAAPDTKIGWANIHISAHVADSALLDITSRFSGDCASFLTLRETVELNAGTYKNSSLAIDLAAARHEIVADVRREGAHVELLGASLSSAGTNCDTLTRVNHHVGRATSNQLFRNVAREGGKTAFQGRVLVEKDAQQTYADQACNNLVLDNKSEANVKPELLIFADDVKCSHGATIGELDKDALFYLIQRGLDPQSARSILINAFLGEVVEAIDSDDIRAHFQEDIDRWMSNSNGGVFVTDIRNSNSSPKLDVEKVRADFPILSETVYDKPLTFLDSGASAQKPKCVIDAISGLYEKSYANIHRGMYKFSQQSTDAYEAVREKVRALLNARHSHECIFVRGATEGINLVAQTWGRANLNQGDEIILTTLEHHSNIVPWQMLREEKGFTIKVVPIDDRGNVIMEEYEKLLGPKVKLVSFVHVSNAIGTILPAKKMAAMAKAVGATVLIDGCQSVPHMAVDVQDLGADFFVFSGHKLYGPTGIGVLYGREELLDAMPPWQGGGDMIASVTFEETIYNELPYKFEAGTPHIAGGIGLGVAIDYVNEIGYDAIAAHEDELLKYAHKELRAINSLRMIGEADQQAGIVSFELNGIHPHDLGTILDREGVAIRTGHHCTQPIMDYFDIPGTARASFGIYNTKEDVDRLVAGIRKAQELFG